MASDSTSLGLAYWLLGNWGFAFNIGSGGSEEFWHPGIAFFLGEEGCWAGSGWDENGYMAFWHDLMAYACAYGAARIILALLDGPLLGDSVTVALSAMVFAK